MADSDEEASTGGRSAMQRYRRLFVTGSAKDSFDSPSLSARLRRWSFETRGGRALLAVDVGLSLLACVMYVFETYAPPPAWFPAVEVAMAGVFAAIFALRTLMAESAVWYVLSGEGLVEVLTILPAAWAFSDSGRSIRLARMLRVLRVMRLARVREHLQSEVAATLVNAVATCVAAMFISGCVVQYVENLGDERDEELTFHASIYFLIVTCTTVGYGDISPQTDLGRLVVAAVVIMGVMWLPVQVGRIVQLLTIKSVYARRKFTELPNTRHVVVCGEVDINAIRDLCSARPTGGAGVRAADHVVLLQPRAPSLQVLALLQSPFSFLSLTYLEGALTDPRALRRAKVARARAVFVLADKHSGDALTADAQTLVRYLSVQRYLVAAALRPAPKLCVQILMPAHRATFTAPRTLQAPSVVCINQVKQGLIGKTVISPGLNTLLCNLIIAPQVKARAGAPEWEREYVRGCQQQVQYSRLAPALRGFTFAQAAAFVYESTRAVLFAVEVRTPVAPSRVLVNPGSWTLPRAPEVELFGFAIHDRPVDLGDVHVATDGSSPAPPLGPRRATGAKKNVGNRFKGAMTRLRAAGRIHSSSDNYAGHSKPDDDDAQDRAQYIDCEMLGSADYRAQLQQRFELREEPKRFKDARVVTAEEAQDHVLVLGELDMLFHFLLPLRSRYLRTMPEVVLLGERPPSDNEWSHLCWFHGVHYVQGSPMDASDLQRAGVASAARVVLLASHADVIAASGGNDAPAVFTFQAVRRLNPRVEIITEVISTDDLEFLSPELADAVRHDGYQLSPHFAAGNVFLSAVIEFLSAHAVYQPALVDLFDELLSDKLHGHHRKWERAVRAILAGGAPPTSSHIFTVPVPQDLVGGNYARLFAAFAADGVIPIGLRRGVIVKLGQGRQGNFLPYVVTAPAPDLLLTPQDTVFVLAERAPETILHVAAGDPALSAASASPKDTFLTTPAIDGMRRRLSSRLGSASIPSTKDTTPEEVMAEVQQLRGEVQELAGLVRGLLSPAPGGSAPAPAAGGSAAAADGAAAAAAEERVLSTDAPRKLPPLRRKQ